MLVEAHLFSLFLKNFSMFNVMFVIKFIFLNVSIKLNKWKHFYFYALNSATTMFKTFEVSLTLLSFKSWIFRTLELPFTFQLSLSQLKVDKFELEMKVRKTFWSHKLFEKDCYLIIEGKNLTKSGQTVISLFFFLTFTFVLGLFAIIFFFFFCI